MRWSFSPAARRLLRGWEQLLITEGSGDGLFERGSSKVSGQNPAVGPIRNVAGIARITYVSLTFCESFSGAVCIHGTGPPNTFVQPSAFALVYLAGPGRLRRTTRRRARTWDRRRTSPGCPS